MKQLLDFPNREEMIQEFKDFERVDPWVHLVENIDKLFEQDKTIPPLVDVGTMLDKSGHYLRIAYFLTSPIDFVCTWNFMIFYFLKLLGAKNIELKVETYTSEHVFLIFDFKMDNDVASRGQYEEKWFQICRRTEEITPDNYYFVKRSDSILAQFFQMGLENEIFDLSIVSSERYNYRNAPLLSFMLGVITRLDLPTQHKILTENLNLLSESHYVNKYSDEELDKRRERTQDFLLSLNKVEV